MLIGVVEERARVVIWSVTKGFETVDLTYKGGDFLVRSLLIALGSGTGDEPGVDVILFFDFVADSGIYSEEGRGTHKVVNK